MTTGKAVNVLFTSAGRRVELLRAFRRAYDSLGLTGRIVAVDVDPLATALQVADRPYLVPPLQAPEFLPALVRICRRESVHIVFPLIDPDIPVLARHRREIEAAGARVAVVSEEAAAATADKWKTLELFRTAGVPVPRSWLPGEIDPDAAEYPLIVKPRFGSAARETFPVRGPEQLRFFQGFVPDPIIQELLPGPEITSDVTCDLEGNLLAVVSRRRIEVRWGEVAKGVTVRIPEVLDACVRIAGVLRPAGPVTIQCMKKDGRYRFTEINPRLGGGVPLGIAAGVDSPRWLLAAAAGLPVEAPPLGTYRTGLYLSRFDDSFFLTEADREAMARRLA